MEMGTFEFAEVNTRAMTGQFTLLDRSTKSPKKPAPGQTRSFVKVRFAWWAQLVNATH